MTKRLERAHESCRVPDRKSIRRIAPMLVLALLELSCPFSFDSARALAAGPEASARGGSPVSESKSTAELAAQAAPSIVVVSHLGRDGEVDGVGTGFVVTPDGLIATCLHVIGEARPIRVEFPDGRRFQVTEVHASDRRLDLALIRIDAEDLPALALGDSDGLRQGDPVVAIGHPQGLEHSIVQGVVSALREFENSPMIQLAIPIEPGNSGGPLFDQRGQVQGILTLKYLLAENLGFAMPVNALKALREKPNPIPMDRWLTIGALDPKQWTPVFDARWRQKAGRILVDTPGSGFGGRSLCLSERPIPERPFEIEVTVKLDDEAGAAGLAFDSDGGDRHYGFYPSAGRLRLTRFDGPNVFTWTILAEVAAPHYQPGDWNTLKVRLEQDQLRCYLNGELVIESADRGLSEGKVGLVKFRQTRAEFRGFRMGTNLPGTTVAPEVEATILDRLRAFPRDASPSSDLLEFLEPYGDSGKQVLLAQAKDLDDRAARIRRLAAVVHRKQIEKALLEELARPEDQIDLFQAALCVAQLDNESIEISHYRGVLDELSRELRSTVDDHADPRDRLAALDDFLFVQNGFHGSRTDYYHRANSYINEVLDDREGIPITLCVLYLELGRRIGLKHLAGIPLPGHFIVQHNPPDGPSVFIDVFDGGARLARSDLERMLRRNTGLPLRDEHLLPANKREIVLRMLRNLIGIALRKESADDALRYLELLLAVAPDSPAERWSRGMLRLQTGDRSGAKADFGWLLENQAPGIDLNAVERAFRSL